MKIGTTTFQEAVKRVARATSPYKKMKTEYGRQYTEANWSAAIRIIFSRDAECLYLFATNGSIFAYDKVDVEITDKDDEPFIAYLFPEHLLEHLALSDGKVDFYKYRDGVRLAPSDKQKFYLKTRYEFGDFFDAYKSVKELPDVEPVSINAIALKNALNFTAYVASGDRTVDKVVIIENIDGKLCFGATDGWRLATSRDVVKVDQPIKCIIYRQFVSTLEGMIEYEEADIKLYFSDNALYFKDGNFVAGALTATEAHDIWNVIETFPEMNTAVFAPDVEMLKKALHIAHHFAENGAGYVTLEIDKNMGRLFAVSQEIGSTYWGLESSQTNDGQFRVSFNPRAIVEFLSHAKTKSVSMHFSNPETAFSVTGDDPDSTLIVMPVHAPKANRSVELDAS